MKWSLNVVLRCLGKLVYCYCLDSASLTGQKQGADAAVEQRACLAHQCVCILCLTPGSGPVCVSPASLNVLTVNLAPRSLCEFLLPGLGLIPTQWLRISGKEISG